MELVQELLAAARANRELLGWLGVFSAVSFVASLIGIPLLIARLPANYFVDRRRHRLPFAKRHPVARWFLIGLKNLAGFCLILAGLVMIPLPGQGLLVILVGIMLMNFPGKYRLERHVVTRPAIARSLNWIRERAGRPPLELREEEPAEGR